MAQTRLPDEIVVVDDGSTDDPGAVAARYPSVRLIRQANSGLSAARNAGLAAIAAEFVTFLDADDLLASDALARNLSLFADHRDAGFVYGAYQRVDPQGRWLSGPHFTPVPVRAWHAMLERNPVGMNAAVLYDTARLRAIGGFDTMLRSCEDYDTYIRLAREHPVHCHDACITSYRMHGANMSGDPFAMLGWALAALDRNRPDRPEDLAAWRKGRRWWKRHYAADAVYGYGRQRGGGGARRLARALTIAPGAVLTGGGRIMKRKIGNWLRRRSRRPGRIDMGSFETVEPVSRHFGYDRGTPLDRHYIEGFLDRHRADIQGRALEIGDASYCRRFGSGVTRQDVLHVHADNPEATLVGDLSQPGVLPDSAFDAMVITQTLHLLIDVPGAIRRLHQALSPGGVLLLTVPGVSPIDGGEWGASWYWSMTAQSVTRLFGEVFGQENITVEVHGNVYAATCFLQGMALEEVRRDLLDQPDPCYPVVVTVRAVRAL